MAYSITSAVHSELVLKKSRFLGCVQPVADRTAAQTVVASLRAAHPAADHVCWALLAGGQSAAVDDGEPSGTAGRPMLEVLRHQCLEGVLATVVRYFGGVKLGAGGLARAYTDCVAQALKNTTKIPLVQMKTLCCVASYALEGAVRREIDATGGLLQQVQHGERVVFVFTLAEDAAAALVAQLGDIGRGQVVWIENAIS